MDMLVDYGMFGFDWPYDIVVLAIPTQLFEVCNSICWTWSVM